ncbi:hypothetical protein Y694_04274 [Methylibium sp. T29-B]|nr:hypothetical protein Y694_04274 [Methylibium sp. T29-B]
MRLTMKSGVERACTGVLRQRSLSANTACATLGSVRRPETTSTSFITGTGLKKCRPTQRPGCRRSRASAVIEIDEVLDASTQSASTIASSCANSVRLASACSTMASTTSRAPAAASIDVAGVMRASVACAASALRRPFATSASRPVASRRNAASAAPSRASCSCTGCPAWAATCAMPAPMMPAPITHTGDCVSSARLMPAPSPTAAGASRRRRQSPRAPRRPGARG